MQSSITFCEGIVMPERPAAKRLSRLPADLIARGFELSPPYPFLRGTAIECVIKAHMVGNIWHYYPDDLPEIEQALRKRLSRLPGRPDSLVAA
jgi:hypothetical protein